ncbi:MAG: hypothetical protein F6J93_27785 [Oscillatoria sp. SIO1A7]|nr:hypothetical protein [Oscillatoria sp. SIO1A7]
MTELCLGEGKHLWLEDPELADLSESSRSLRLRDVEGYAVGAAEVLSFLKLGLFALLQIDLEFRIDYPQPPPAQSCLLLFDLEMVPAYKPTRIGGAFFRWESLKKVEIPACASFQSPTVSLSFLKDDGGLTWGGGTLTVQLETIDSPTSKVTNGTEI